MAEVPRGVGGSFGESSNRWVVERPCCTRLDGLRYAPAATKPSVNFKERLCKKMNSGKSWNLLDLQVDSDPEDQCEQIAEKLSTRSKDDLISFANIHLELLNKAYTWPMLKASYILVPYASDDAFEDFRNWVILHGKERFYKNLVIP